MYLTSLPRSRSSCYGEAWPQKMEPSSAVGCRQGGCTSTIGSPTNRYNLLYNLALVAKIELLRVVASRSVGSSDDKYCFNNNSV